MSPMNTKQPVVELERALTGARVSDTEKAMAAARAETVSVGGVTPGNFSGRRCSTATASRVSAAARGWMLLTQVGLLFAIGSLGGLDPQQNIWPILWLAALLAFLSGTQDIAVDAFRREILADHELGLGNAEHVNAYRIAGLIPGSLSLILADRLPWSEVFWITGAFMIPGMVMAWLVSEPVVTGAAKTLRQGVTEPFHEFINRQGWRGADLVLAFIFLYKLGDSLCTAPSDSLR